MVSLLDTYCGCYMAQTSNNLARDYGISREEQDEFAILSQQRAGEAWERLPAERGGRAGRGGEGQAGEDRSSGTTTCAPRPRWRTSRACPPRSTRTAS